VLFRSVKVGAQDAPDAEPTWSDTMTHTVGSTVANDCLVDARYHAIRFETGTAYQWRLDSVDVDVVPAGDW
jgi:hypothetical protein